MIRKAVVTALAVVALSLPLAGMSFAAPLAKELSCRTWVQGEGKEGVAECVNRTNRAIAFRAFVVCGLQVDQVGPWVTLNPGEKGSSSARCVHGAGSVDWQEG